MTRPVILGATALVMAFAGARDPAAQQLSLPYDDAAAVERGAALYAENCASCHGDQLQGEPNWRQRGEDGLMPAPPHDETGHTWHHSDEILFQLTKFGPGALIEGYQSNMPGFDGVLTDQQILDTLGYIKSTWPARMQQIQDARNGG